MELQIEKNFVNMTGIKYYDSVSKESEALRFKSVLKKKFWQVTLILYEWFKQSIYPFLKFNHL